MSKVTNYDQTFLDIVLCHKLQKGSLVTALPEVFPQPSTVLLPLLTLRSECCAMGKPNLENKLGALLELGLSTGWKPGRVGTGMFNPSLMFKILSDKLYILKGRIISTWLLRGIKE